MARSKFTDSRGYRHPINDKRFRKHWIKFRKKFITDNPLCAMCMRKAQCLDHIEPLKNYAEVTMETLLCVENIQSLCFRCHSLKTASENVRNDMPEFCICGYPYNEGEPRCQEKQCWERHERLFGTNRLDHDK